MKNKKINMKGGKGCGMKNNYPFEGESSDYSPDMKTKNFAGKQPVWSANTR